MGAVGWQVPGTAGGTPLELAWRGWEAARGREPRGQEAVEPRAKARLLGAGSAAGAPEVAPARVAGTGWACSGVGVAPQNFRAGAALHATLSPCPWTEGIHPGRCSKARAGLEPTQGCRVGVWAGAQVPGSPYLPGRCQRQRDCPMRGLGGNVLLSSCEGPAGAPVSPSPDHRTLGRSS